MPAALIALALLVAGGVGLGAEQATPGDTLYPVKVGVNEKVRGALQFTAEDSAEWRTSLVERRLTEAERLALSGELDAAAVVVLETRLEAHVDAYEKEVEELRTEENYEAIADLSSHFESSLRAHRAILVEIAAAAEAELKTQLENLIAGVDTEITTVTAIRTEAEAQIDSELTGDVSAAAAASVEARLDAAETHVENLIRFVDEKGDRLSATARAQAEARIAAAETDIAEARTRLEAEAYAETQSLIRAVNDVVNETRTMVTASGTLGLGLNTDNSNEADNEENEEKNADNNTDEDSSADSTDEGESSNNDANMNGKANVNANTNTDSGETSIDGSGSSKIKINIGM